MVTAIIVAVSIISGVVSVAVLFSRALSTAFSSLDSMHKRAIEHEKGLLDRLMAVDYATFKSYQLSEESEDGWQEQPEARFGLKVVPTDDEALLVEDFE